MNRDYMPLRILVDNGEYMLQNKGDLALLAITVERLVERWPDARVGVITFQPRMLRAYLPRAEPIAFSKGGHWPEADWFDRLAETLGPALIRPTIGVRSRSSAFVRSRARAVRRSTAVVDGGSATATGGEEADPATHPVPAALEQSDLVVAAGGGYMADVDQVKAHWTLNLLERAASHGIPTAMLGQGLGPLEDPALVARGRAVLPRVDLIAVREPRVGPSLLARWGVPPARILVTGDDAIEIAYRAASAELGTAIGVCLRATSYAPVAGIARTSLRSGIQASAHDVGARLVPLFISEYESEDRRATMPLVAGFPDVVRPMGRNVSADAFVRRVAQCRVIVTGAYHLAVFALSQGVPVVALTASRYSEDKMQGLGAQFGTGLSVVRLAEDDLQARSRDAISAAWASAPSVRAELLEAARAQIERSRAAFEMVFALVTESGGARGARFARAGARQPVALPDPW